MSDSNAPIVPLWMVALIAILLVVFTLTAAVIPLWTRILLGLLGLTFVVESVRRRST